MPKYQAEYKIEEDEQVDYDFLESLFTLSREELLNLISKLNKPNSKEEKELLKNTFIRKQSNIKHLLKCIKNTINFNDKDNSIIFLDGLERDLEVIFLIDLLTRKE